MSYLTLLLAWLQMLNSSLPGNAWGYEFWSKVVSMNQWIYDASWTIWWISLILMLVMLVITLLTGGRQAIARLGLGCGCIILIVMFVLLLLPIGALINLGEAKAILSSVSPELGIINGTKFWVSIFFFFLLGVF